MQETGARIRDARDSRGWSQKRLAREAGVSENTVLDAENGKRRTQGEKLQAIMDALDMAASEDDAVLDLAGVPEDARAFLRVAVQRLTGMEEAVRARLLNTLYPRLIVEETTEQREIREARERRLGELVPEQQDGVEETRRAQGRA